jgi:hypothetical protein
MCYLSPANGHQRCVLEDETLPRHLVMRVEELIHLSVVSLDHLVILLHQGVEGGLDDVVLVEVRFIDAGASFLHA